jgi:hypothetical protein
MTDVATANVRPMRGLGNAAASLLAALVFLGLHAAAGFPSLVDAGSDNDSLLRLVEVRDLIGGQAWFDLTQNRLGPDGGVTMHWSRLVDAPIAAVMLAASVLTGSAAIGEAAARVLWPAGLFFAAMLFMLRAARHHGGEDAVLPALVIGAAALHYTAAFAPGALDHHNVEIVLALATVSFLLEALARGGLAPGAAAGACSALMMAVGMEALPYVAAGGAAAATAFLLAPHRMWRTAAGFGLGLGGVAAVAFAATVSPDAWSAAECDRFSLPHLAAAALAGPGLAVVAGSSALRSSRGLRLAALAGLAALLAGLLAAFFPACLADPYASLDPRLQDLWLDAVIEAQPLAKVLALDPAMAAGHYGPPVLALLCLAASFRNERRFSEAAVIGAFLGAALLVSVWQIRGSLFSVPLAAVPLAALVARRRQPRSGTAPDTAKLLAAWLGSFSVVWSLAAGGLVRTQQSGIAATPSATLPGSCGAEGDFRDLAALPSTGVLVVSNLGAPVLAYTPHRVLAGPYHRNVEGNLAALDAFTGAAETAQDVVWRHGMTVVALCAGNDETRFLAGHAPHGFLAGLTRGDVPGWLERLPGSESDSLRLFRVRAHLSDVPAKTAAMGPQAMAARRHTRA